MRRRFAVSESKKIEMRCLIGSIIEPLFRREIVQLALRSLSDCVHSFLSSTYISFTFLLMYGAMWIFDIRFDTRFFAVAYSLLGHTGIFVMEAFTEAIRGLAKYIAAQKRLQVGI